MARHCKNVHGAYTTMLKVDQKPRTPYFEDWHDRVTNPMPVQMRVYDDENSSSHSSQSCDLQKQACDELNSDEVEAVSS